ncbi:ribosome assembly cofactor RimP [Olivibacter sp. SDN3]|uniref:ribosome assembly cofactor RimP n=1 Tax=Olivibacter sp. SDN3 TaxID=2764720 RepID=UPI00165183AC|nr:ribosome assembly cofactor RimP [Olivibacter sp. SDN3]QNL51402.1 ribosome assembly cofactor RimP [Olivibacter sp. SDN3]
MSIEQRVIALVEEKIADRSDLFLVDVNMHSNGKLVIHVDGDQGISIQDCAAISRHVGFHLEEEDAISDAYNLEVSSPGIDAPLRLERQYKKNIGRAVSLKMTSGNKREGKLLAATEGHLQIEETVKEKGKKAVQVQNTIPLDLITEIKVLISFK